AGERAVRMPVLALVLVGRLSFYPGVEDQSDLRMLRVAKTGRSLAVVIDFTETPGERDMLLGGERLIAKDQHTMLQKRRPDRGYRRVVQRLAQVDAGHLGSQRIRGPTNLNTHISPHSCIDSRAVGVTH